MLTDAEVAEIRRKRAENWRGPVLLKRLEELLADKLGANESTGHQALILFALASAPPALIATFTASSIGSLKGTSIRSSPCS